MPSVLGLRTLNGIHRALIMLTRGRIGAKVLGMPVLELTTTGRSSGRAHSVMLTSPARYGDAVVVVASRGGDDHHPAWFLNLLARPEVEVTFVGMARRSMIARTATAAEHATLWPRVTAAYRGYATYQARTDREIPLVLLEEPQG